MKKNDAAQKKITRARVGLLNKQPFWGHLAMNLRMIEDPELRPPTAATDGKNIFYHPEWVISNDVDVVMSMEAHEVAHVVFDHVGRRNGREPIRWNYANDYQVNLVLKDCGFVIPPSWLYDEKYIGMSSDSIYLLLPEAKEDSLGRCYIPGTKEGQAPFDAPPQGEPMKMEEWEATIVQAANAQREHGHVPGSLNRFVTQILAPESDWRSVMTRFAREVSRDDYSYRSINRKMAAHGYILPGLYSETMGLMAAGFDTSGSISQDIFNAFGAHLTEIRNQMKPQQMVNIFCDSRINRVDTYDDDGDMNFSVCGGGGTNFCPPFEYIEKHNLHPACFMYLTDGYGRFPDVPPEFPVLWLMTTDVVPPWGEVVRIEV